MADTHEARVTALADALGIPEHRVVSVLRLNKATFPTHDSDGNPLFRDSDGAYTDEEVVDAAFRNIDQIRKVTGR